MTPGCFLNRRARLLVDLTCNHGPASPGSLLWPAQDRAGEAFSDRMRGPCVGDEGRVSTFATCLDAAETLHLPVDDQRCKSFRARPRCHCMRKLVLRRASKPRNNALKSIWLWCSTTPSYPESYPLPFCRSSDVSNSVSRTLRRPKSWLFCAKIVQPSADGGQSPRGEPLADMHRFREAAFLHLPVDRRARHRGHPHDLVNADQALVWRQRAGQDRREQAQGTSPNWFRSSAEKPVSRFGKPSLTSRSISPSASP